MIFKISIAKLRNTTRGVSVSIGIILKTVLSLHRWFIPVKLVIAVFAVSSCLFASDNHVLSENSNGHLLDSEQRIFPIYRDDIFYRYAKGKVFFVIGTSSAGKSSIIKNLIKYIPSAKREEFLISGHDDLLETIILKNIRCKLGEKLNFVTREDLLYCLLATRMMPPESMIAKLDTNAVFKKHRQLLLSEEWHNSISQLSSCPFSEEDAYLSAEKVMLNIVNGKNVILDAVTFMPFIFALENNFIRYGLYNIYVYSPPRKLTQHIVKRLQESLLTVDKKDMRLFFPYEQYLNLYTLGQGIRLTKKEILSDCTGIIANSGLPNPEKRHLITLLKEVENMGKPWQEKIISEWFPGDTEVICLKPKCPKVDLLLDTSVLSTSEAVSAILPILNSVINQG